MKVLAIETSCDETAAAVVERTGRGLVKVHSNVIASQIKLHAHYGGVFPDLAAKEHVKNIIPTINLALHEARLLKDPKARGRSVQVAMKKIDAIAITQGPGLVGSLLVGVNAASMLSKLSNKPLIPINHWEGHIYSVFLKKTLKIKNQKSKIKGSDVILRSETTKDLDSSATPQNDSKEEHSQLKALPKFPILILTVSGGHTSIILMKNHFEYEILGNTIDDAAGEAFDKTARMLGLGFPGGPMISRFAQEARIKNYEARIKLPRPMLNSKNFNFSFSGLKTAVLYAIKRGDIVLSNTSKLEEEHVSATGSPSRWSSNVAAAAREIEEAIVEVLVTKTFQAAQLYKPKTIAVVGGVSANNFLRQEIIRTCSLSPVPCHLLLPHLAYTTDNAAMIGAAAIFRLSRKKSILEDPLNLDANPSLRLG